MKIPQRQDQVSLISPQVATGQAVEPVAEAMGSSYVDTMKGLSKSMQELSDLSYKLYENAIEGQQQRLKLYTSQRTKQYEQELGLATTQTQIDELTNVYKEDIKKVGGSLLGADRYSNWYSREGGAIVAGSEYAGAVAKAQLQINANKQNIEDMGDKYNVAAFTAKTVEDRTDAIKSYEEMLDANVKNGTISTSEKANMQRDWNQKLAIAIIERELERNTEETVKQLQTNPDYFPGITSERRNMFIEQGLRLIKTREGTQASTNVKNLKSFWIEIYKSGEQNSFDLSMKLFSEAKENFGKFRNSVKDLFAEIKKENPNFEGFDIDSISGVEVEEFARWAETTVKNANQEKVQQFWEARSDLDQDFNSKIFYIKDGDKKPINIATINRYNYDNNPNKLVELYRQNVKQKDNIQFSTIINSSDSTRNKINEQQGVLSAIYVEGLKKSQRGSTEWENNMYNTLSPIYSALIADGLVGDADKKMRQVVEYLWDHYEPSEVFSKREKINYDLIGPAIGYAGIPLWGKTGKVFSSMFLSDKKGVVNFVVPEISYLEFFRQYAEDYYGGQI